MKIAVVCDLYSTYLRFRRFFTEELARRGHTVEVIVSEQDIPEDPVQKSAGITLDIVEMDRTGVNPFGQINYYRRLRLKLSEYRPDCVFAYQAKAAVWGAVAGRRLGCDVHILFPGLGYLFAPKEDLKGKTLQMVAVKLYRFAFRKIQTAIFQNPDDEKTLLEAGIIREDTNILRVNGSGVPLDEWQYQPVSKGPVNFVMATRLLADKGIREFVEAGTALKKEYGDSVRFQIAGSLDTNPNSIQKDEVDGWKDCGIEYVGQVDDMVKFLGESSVFVLPSYYMEGTPRSILEALAVGRPVITTDFRGCRETVDDGVNGFLTIPRDPQDLKMKMESFVKNSEIIDTMGKQSRKIAEEKYDVRLICEQMIQAIGA